jgi:hypothetical protein
VEEETMEDRLGRLREETVMWPSELLMKQEFSRDELEMIYEEYDEADPDAAHTSEDKMETLERYLNVHSSWCWVT